MGGAGSHPYDGPHRDYNTKSREAFDKWLDEFQIDPGAGKELPLTKDQAAKVAESLRDGRLPDGSIDDAMRRFNASAMKKARAFARWLKLCGAASAAGKRAVRGIAVGLPAVLGTAANAPTADGLVEFVAGEIPVVEQGMMAWDLAGAGIDLAGALIDFAGDWIGDTCSSSGGRSSSGGISNDLNREAMHTNEAIWYAK